MNVRRMRGRRAIALLVVIAASLAFAVRLVDVQLVSAAGLNEDAHDKRAVPVSIPSVRGDIVDRNGEILATTDERYDVQLSPKNTRLNDGKFYRPAPEGGVGTVEVTAEEAFAEIGEVTGQTAEEIEEIVDEALEENPKSDFAYVERAVDLTQLNALKELGIPWLTFASHHTRSYPSGAVAGNIVGFAGFEDVPQAGIELAQDACLTGVDGSEVYERGADGVALPGSVVVTQEAEDGGTVELTIDRDLNWQAQQAINEQVDKVSAEWGRMAIVDVDTGELVAVAEDGSVDPNDVDASDSTKREARSFVDPYEPGSTFKMITAATLIEEGKADAYTQQLSPSTWEPEPGVRFGDAFSHAAEPWTLTGIMVHSSNVGISKLGTRVSAETRFEYMQRFGFGEATGTGMPVEDTGYLIPVEDWDRQTNYNTMFGQGVSATLVQMAGAYQAIANGGERIPLSLVRSCTDAEGNTTVPKHGEPTRAVSEETAAEMMRILETVPNENWYTEDITIPGYRLAGKTGTAEQSDGQGGYRANYVYSFAGIFPADDPQFVAVASIGFPTSGDGGAAARAAFKSAAEATIRSFHIPPSSGKYKPLPIEY